MIFVWVTENFPLLHMMLAQFGTKLVVLLFPRRRPYESIFRSRYCIEFIGVNGIIVLPLHQSIEVATFPIHAEVWPWGLATFYPVQGQNLRICIALEVLEKYVGAMTKMNPPHLILGIHLWFIARIVREGGFAE